MAVSEDEFTPSLLEKDDSVDRVGEYESPCGVYGSGDASSDFCR